MCPIRAGRHGERPVLREAEHRDCGTRPARKPAGNGRRPRSRTRSTATSLRRSNATTSAGSLPAGLQLDDGVALSRDDVGRGHDQIRLRHPAGALDADSAGHAEHTHDARRGAADADRVRQASGRAARPARPGPVIAGNGSMRASAFSTSVGRDELVQPLQQTPTPARRGEGRSAPAAAARRPRAPTRPRRPAKAPRISPPVASNVLTPRLAHPRPERRPGQCPERLEQDRADRGAGQRRQRRVRRVSSVLEKLRRKPRSQPAPEDDPGQGERARDEPLLPADEAP